MKEFRNVRSGPRENINTMRAFLLYRLSDLTLDSLEVVLWRAELMLENLSGFRRAFFI